MISEYQAESIMIRLKSSLVTGANLRLQAMQLLADLPNYDWTGVYRLEGRELVLDEFVGAATDHTRIGIGVGVCGTAVAEGRNQVVADVTQLDNYLSCSVATRSEIVVLIKDGAKTLGQIDVDGHVVGAFDRSDELFLECVAQVLAERW